MVPHPHHLNLIQFKSCWNGEEIIWAARDYLRLEIWPWKRILMKIRGGSQVVHIRPDSTGADAFGQVLRFRRGPGKSRLANSTVQPRKGAAEPDDDLARYEREDSEPTDDRHRMLMNLIAVAIVTVLVGTGVWLADTITDMARDQDCVMQGRANCAPITAAIPHPR
jgi:hypothetical protein